MLALTEKIVTRDQLTTLMITHNMRDALRYGNRLIMLHNGRVIIDVQGEEKKHLQIADLLEMFEQASGASVSRYALRRCWMASPCWASSTFSTSNKALFSA